MKNNTRKFTEKDLAYITDMFSWNLQAVKLANHFLQEAEKEEVQELLEEIFDMHYENLNKCISILEGNHQEEEEYEEWNEEIGEEENAYDEEDEDEDSYEEDSEEEDENE